MKLSTLHEGSQTKACQTLQVAVNRRLDARDLSGYRVTVDGVLGERTLLAVRKAAWALGAEADVFEAVTRQKRVTPHVQQLILNPGRRTEAQLGRARGRRTGMLADRRRRAKEAQHANALRLRIVALAQEAAANYRRNPGAYHYLAGGKANTEFLKPTPRDWRSDCSQFVASVYKAAGAESPAAPLAHEWASTYSIVASPHAKVTDKPRPGDLGMYGSRTAPHHVELYCGRPGQEFIGHGSPPIDSLTPGRPDFYVTFDFLG